VKYKIIFIFLTIFAISISSGYCAQPGEKWQEYLTTHFIVYYKDAPLDFIKNVEEAAERYYTEITDNLGFARMSSWCWDNRGKIYIYSDNQEYLNASHHASWSSGTAVMREKIIRTFPQMHGFFDTVLPHELGHIIFREFVGFHGNIPLWLDEGVAMYQEKAKRWGVNRIVKQAIEEKKFIPLNELTRKQVSSEASRESVELFYAESASVVYYLITEFGKYRFAEFCRRLKEMHMFDSALEAAYARFRNTDDLNKAWLESLQR